MRDRIWAELTQTKHDTEFISLYSDRQRLILRYFNAGVLIFSTGGILGWKIWDTIPAIACIIISAVSFLRLLQPHIIMTDKLLNNLDRVNSHYNDKYNQLERLWYDFEAGRKTDLAANKRLFEIVQKDKELLTTLDDTVRSKPKCLVRKAKEDTDNYFNQVFNTNNHE